MVAVITVGTGYDVWGLKNWDRPGAQLGSWCATKTNDDFFLLPHQLKFIIIVCGQANNVPILGIWMRLSIVLQGKTHVTTSKFIGHT